MARVESWSPTDARVVVSGVAGAGLLRTEAWLALALLVLNDQVLKARFPGLVTGKLSDAAGLAFFPTFLQALVEVTTRSRQLYGSRRVLMAATLLTALVFAWTKATPLGAEAYRIGLGWLSWPLHAITAWLSGQHGGAATRVRFAQDASDLWTLPAVLLPLWLDQRRRAARSKAASDVGISLT